MKATTCKTQTEVQSFDSKASKVCSTGKSYKRESNSLVWWLSIN